MDPSSRDVQPNESEASIFVLPQTHSIIAHNLVSVFVVGIVGGYGGTRVLDFAGKKLTSP